jgi:hydrogenase maturation protease
MKTLVLGVGNPILSDDGVGVLVVQELENRIDQREVTVMDTSLASLDVLELLSGYDKAIIIDAIQTEEGKAGQIYRLSPGAFDVTRNTASPHDVNFADSLELGKRLGLALPRQIVIFAIEIADASTFSEECTPEVRRAIPVCAGMIIQELNGGCDT